MKTSPRDALSWAIAIAAIAGCDSELGSGDSVLRYALCAANVATVEVGEVEGGEAFAVHVRLREPASREFKDFTARHVGEELEVTSAGRVLVRAKIARPIASGVISTPPLPTRELAEAIREAIAGSSSRQCGIGSEQASSQVFAPRTARLTGSASVKNARSRIVN